MMKAGGLVTRLEDRVFKEGDDDDNSPADIAYSEPGGKETIGDIRITNAVSSAQEQGRPTSKGKVVENSEKAKEYKYGARARAAGYAFQPLVVSCQGEWGAGFRSTFDKLIKFIKRDNINPYSASKVYWTKRISVCIQRCQSTALLYRIQQTCRKDLDTPEVGDYSDMAYQGDIRRGGSNIPSGNGVGG